MNIAYKQVYALIFSLAIMAPLSGMENSIAGIESQVATEVTEAVVNSAVWYKKTAVQVAAAVTTAAAGYAFAARMGRVAVPAFVITLCTLALGAKKVRASDDAQNVQNNDNDIRPTAISVEPTAIPVQNTQDGVTFDATGMHIKKQLKDTWTMVSKEVTDLWKECKNSDICFE